ncbi:DUF262 domain-containing protein [Microbacterium sp. SLBN-146]|uniref:DUF262 domain-containing protein n=1 Tax=Microbacterium sp. SLBN-146 TaxID=2768457 RepID=UPI00115061F7|nr:DUF262 domain-containing protein [Microbacterium sp. SLBN-146]TQJ32092.1 uncharacterized protein DUF1524 [Microbacterium sp. SLBN-146]
MAVATNIDATAVNTISWLSDPKTAIVVPVYQRQYRWDIGGCEQLLADVRAAAASGSRSMHFIGSILSSVDGDSSELVLIDGQQRITTLMLLVAALHHTIRETDAGLASELEAVLVRPTDPGKTKLRPHDAWAGVFQDVVLERRSMDAAQRDSRFDDNYAFFRSQISAEEAPLIWAGVQRLEHVAITLGAGANAQQIFASLNSTGEPLRDHELIHNYVLMGLSHAEQSEIEDEYWLPIEQATGAAIGAFWRHYLVMLTGREVAVAGEHGVYSAFRQRFPRIDFDTLRAHAHEWRAYADIYRTLLEPSRAHAPELVPQLTSINTFARGAFPLVMRAYRDYEQGRIALQGLVDTLEHVQSLYLRRTVVGLSNDRLIARLCRARDEGPDELIRAITRITPSDERVRAALKYSDLPHAAHVLSRIFDVDADDAPDVEHVVPLSPRADWTGDGVRVWADLTDDEQNSHRALAQTLGNLTLLEEPLAMRALDASFPSKRDIYRSSGVAATRSLAELDHWGTKEITTRTVALTDRFLDVWRRPAAGLIDDDGLTPILDAVRRRGWPRGWEREFEYTEYRGEHWEVYDVKYLFNRIFKRLWADERESVIRFSENRGGPLYPARAWNGQWDQLDDETYLYMGWDSKYMLTAVQGVLDEAGLAREVFVKYSYIGAAM